MASRQEIKQLLDEAIATGDTARIQYFSGKLGLPAPDRPNNDPQLQVDTGWEEAANVARGLPGNMLAGLAESGNALGRSMAEGFDFLTMDGINNVLALAGSDTQVPTLTDGFNALPGAEGGFVAPGAGRDALRGYWGATPAALGMVPVSRNIASPVGAGMEFLGLGAARSQPSVAPLAFGAEGARPAVVDGLPAQGPRGTDIVPWQSQGSQARNEMVNAGSESRQRAGYALDPYTGRATADPAGRETMRQGFSDRLTAMVSQANDATRAGMARMLDLQEAGMDNLRDSIHYPSDVLGDGLLRRYDAVEEVRRDAGKRLNAAVKGLADETVDVGAPFQRFAAELDEMGITMDQAGARDFLNGLTMNPDDFLRFRGSDIEGMAGEEAPFRRLMGRVLRMAASGEAPTAKEIHQLKKYLDYNISYGKRLEGSSGNTQRIFQNLRHGLDSALDDAFPAYKQANDQYRDAVRPLRALDTYMGSVSEPGMVNANADLGTLVRRITSRARSRVPIMNTMEELDRVAKRYTTPGTEVGPYTGGGGRLAREVPNFDDDLIAQAHFANELERVFGASANTSFLGDIGKAMEKGAVDTALQNGGSLWGTVASGVHSGLDYLRGINEDNALRSLRDLVGRGRAPGE